MTRYNISLTKKALKQLSELDESFKGRILETLVILRDHGFPRRLDIKKLRSYRNNYRVRIVKYRVLFELFYHTYLTVNYNTSASIRVFPLDAMHILNVNYHIIISPLHGF